MYRYRLNLRVLMLFEELEKEEGGEGRDCNENRSFVHDKSSSYFPFQGVVGLCGLALIYTYTATSPPSFPDSFHQLTRTYNFGSFRTTSLFIVLYPPIRGGGVSTVSSMP